MSKENKATITNEYPLEKMPAVDLDIEESIRRRPFMWVENDIVLLLRKLMADVIHFFGAGKIMFEITICGDNDFVLGITIEYGSKEFWKNFFSGNIDHYYPIALRVISSRLEIKKISPEKTEMHISFNKEIYPHAIVDYIKLSEKVLQFALLNRRCEITTIDKRQAFINQNCYHFPQGVFYLFERATIEVLGKPEFKITFDGTINDRSYQIGLAYRTDWYPAHDVVSFANDITTYPSTLVDGVLEGLISACRKYIKENNLHTYQIKRGKFINGLILVCAVSGENLQHGGSFKERLEDEVVKKDVKKLMTKLTLDFFREEKEKADKFLWRFDTGHSTSSMY
ncbi:MAG: hypothetical protein LUE98_12855 [Tannerellaceae bacterium]|nr:hypothetical protein [Tannerellaceae bacterium]